MQSLAQAETLPSVLVLMDSDGSKGVNASLLDVVLPCRILRGMKRSLNRLGHLCSRIGCRQNIARMVELVTVVHRNSRCTLLNLKNGPNPPYSDILDQHAHRETPSIS